MGPWISTLSDSKALSTFIEFSALTPAGEWVVSFEVENDAVGLGMTKPIDVGVHEESICGPERMSLTVPKSQVVGLEIDDGRMVPNKSEI